MKAQIHVTLDYNRMCSILFEEKAGINIGAQLTLDLLSSADIFWTYAACKELKLSMYFDHVNRFPVN